jgi:hypothetical protein
MMERSGSTVVAAVLLAFVMGGHAFTAPSTAVRDKTSLDAMPPMIIGGMLKKMREEDEKKNVPMASVDEAINQSPGLRVGGDAWKWPPIWPYDQQFFTPSEDIPKPKPTSQLNGMAGMLSGVSQIPETPDETEMEGVEGLDALNYWGTENGDVRTELDAEAVEKLKR